MYPDDTNVTFSAATIPDLESQINSDLQYIDRWLKAKDGGHAENVLVVSLQFRSPSGG